MRKFIVTGLILFSFGCSGEGAETVASTASCQSACSNYNDPEPQCKDATLECSSEIIAYNECLGAACGAAMEESEVSEIFNDECTEEAQELTECRANAGNDDEKDASSSVDTGTGNGETNEQDGGSQGEGLLLVEPETVRFPTLKVGEQSEQSIVLENRAADSPVTISSVTLEEGDSDDHREFTKGRDWFESETLLPDESASLSITYAPMNTKPDTGEVVIRTNASNGDDGVFRIQLRPAEMRGELFVEERIPFGRVGVGASDWQITAVKNIGSAPINFSGAQIRGNDAFRLTYVDPDARDDSNVNNDLQEPPTDKIDPEESIDLRVWFEPDTAGPVSAELILQTESGQSVIQLTGEGN